MNKELKDRVFKLPQDIINQIHHTVGGLNGKHVNGLNRAQKLLNDKSVTYGQLKRIIHDLQSIDKVNDRVKYNLAGGDLMDRWSKQFLQGERNLVSNAKDSRKRADEIGSITGERKNSHLSTHKKKDNYSTPTNLIKSNSDKTSVSSITPNGLFEEIQKIKKLIIY
jgi:hypothetical protein